VSREKIISPDPFSRVPTTSALIPLIFKKGVAVYPVRFSIPRIIGYRQFISFTINNSGSISQVKQKLKNNPVVFIILVITAMIAWGGSWVSGKVIAGTLPSEVLVFWRFLVTFISFIPIVILFKENLKIKKESAVMIIFAAIVLVVYNQVFFSGLKAGYAGAGGVLVTSLNPIFCFILSVIFFKTRISVKDIFGLILGLAGGLVLIQIWNISLSKMLLSGNLLFLIAAFLWALLTVTSHKAQNNISLFTFSFYLYGISTLIDLFFALPHGVLDALNCGPLFWFNIFFLAIVATTFATTVFFLGSRKLGSGKAGSFTFLVPINAVFLSYIFLGEIPGLYTILGGFLAMIAVYIITIYQPEKRT
jgi:drug/metabolite transporter (DMT)-like permease